MAICSFIFKRLYSCRKPCMVLVVFFFLSKLDYKIFFIFLRLFLLTLCWADAWDSPGFRKGKEEGVGLQWGTLTPERFTQRLHSASAQLWGWGHWWCGCWKRINPCIFWNKLQQENWIGSLGKINFPEELPTLLDFENNTAVISLL